MVEVEYLTECDDEELLDEAWDKLSEFLKDHARRVPANAQAAWCILFRHTHMDGMVRMGRQQLADSLGVSKRTATRTTRRLREAGFLEVIERGCGCVPTVYRLHSLPRQGRDKNGHT